MADNFLFWEVAERCNSNLIRIHYSSLCKDKEKPLGQTLGHAANEDTETLPKRQTEYLLL